jgi:hypothetical protein
MRLAAAPLKKLMSGRTKRANQPLSCQPAAESGKREGGVCYGGGWPGLMVDR